VFLRQEDELTKKAQKSALPFAKAKADGRDPQTGRFLPGNGERLIHGLRSARAMAALLPGQEAQLRVLREQVNELMTDLGGAAHLGVVKREMAVRFCELRVVGTTLAESLVREGVLSAKGRQRAALTAYLSVIDRLTRLAAVLGMERTAKRVPSLDDFLAQSRKDGDPA
jgi:hypothetical protein